MYSSYFVNLIFFKDDHNPRLILCICIVRTDESETNYRLTIYSVLLIVNPLLVVFPVRVCEIDSLTIYLFCIILSAIENRKKGHIKFINYRLEYNNVEQCVLSQCVSVDSGCRCCCWCDEKIKSNQDFSLFLDCQIFRQWFVTIHYEKGTCNQFDR